jgi:3D (Asp-Asp-Asp) domain-containing protein
MKKLMLNAAVILSAAGLLASCSSMDSTTGSNLRLLPKSQVTSYAGGSLWRSSSRTVSSTGLIPAAPSVAVKRSAAYLPKDRHGMPTYPLSQRVRYVRTTAYSHMENEPGAPGRLNASGTILKYGAVRSAAADWSLYPVGTTFRIKGLPYTYVVDDYGSGLVGTNTIDIFHPTLSGMRAWATRDAEINVIHWGSWERTVNLLRGRTRHPHCAQMYAGVIRRIARGEVARTGGTTRPAL